MRTTSGPKCRLCRREGHKLFLKGEKCLSAKCPVTIRPYAPGMHGKDGFKKMSGFGKQLRAKQEAKRIYGLSETQLQNYFETSSNKDGSTGDFLMGMLELRLDSVIFRSGLVTSPNLARQLASHGHVLVNGHTVKTPSRILVPGDVFTIKSENMQKALQNSKGLKVQLPSWLKFDSKAMKGEIVSAPSKEDLAKVNVNIKEIVEFYSR